MNSPFLLRPAAKDYLWGGNRLNDEFAKEISVRPLAETWECSTHPDGLSMVASGAYRGKTLHEVLALHPEYLGTHPLRAHDFCQKGELPFLIKFIDANQDLSVQVHPTDEYAVEHENGQLGKTEMWYVLDAAKDASLVYGLKHNTDKQQLEQAVVDGRLDFYLQRIPVQKDDVFFIEAGTIHAIGAGTLIAEIQENSNLTYRLYDYDRVDKDGKKRDLHVEKALDVANLNRASEPRQPLRALRYRQGVADELLGRCKYFEVHRLLVNTERRQVVSYAADNMSFRVLLCINGCGTIRIEKDSDLQRESQIRDEEILEIYKGDCVFVPADSVQMRLHGKMQFLEVVG